MSQSEPQAAAASLLACLFAFANVDLGMSVGDGGIKKAALVCCLFREGFKEGMETFFTCFGVRELQTSDRPVLVRQRR